MASLGLVRVQTNRDIEAAQQQALTVVPAETGPVLEISHHITKFWQVAQTAKLPIERRLLRSLRQREGVYEPDVLSQIREQGGSEIFMMLTSAKCRALEAWLREIWMGSETPWGLDPTPIPELPPMIRDSVVRAVTAEALAAGWEVNDARIDERLLAVKSEALQRVRDIAEQIAKRHELRILDQFAEGGFKEALDAFIYDLATFQSAFIKAPILRRRKTRKFVQLETGQWVAAVSPALRLEYERRSPFDMYPAPSMKDLRYGNLIDRYRFKRSELQALVGVPGFSDEALHAAIEEYGTRGYTSVRMNDYTRAVLEMRPLEQIDPEQTIEALNFWGSVPGYMLQEWMGSYNVGQWRNVKPYDEYEIEAWKVGRFTIKAVVNPDPLGERPYSCASFEQIPDSIWGQSLPDVMMDSQGMCNGVARAIANNASMASGPMEEINVDRLAEGETVGQAYPWRVYQTTTDMTGNNQAAVRFFQPQINAQELIYVYNHFERVADNETAVPNYSYGDARVGGAGRTASGLSQLLAGVGKGVRRVVTNGDLRVFGPVVTRTFNYNMENDPDPTIKGDLRAVPRGTAADFAREQTALRVREALQAGLNPIDAQLMGMEGRAELWRQLLKALGIGADKVLPDKLIMQLRAAGMPPLHEVLGNAGPNAPSASPGIAGGGGTPAGAETTDFAGMPPQGVRQRLQNSGYRTGGRVIDQRPTSRLDVEDS